MPDFGTLLTVLIGAFGGALATAAGSYYRNRRTARTAALLVYVELAENTSQVRFYRLFNKWPEATLQQTAWQQNSTTLAQLASLGTFQAIRKGYAALEGIAFVAKGPAEVASLSHADLEKLVEGAIVDVSEGLRQAGGLAGMDRTELAEQIAAVGRASEPAAGGPTAGRAASRARHR
jgi:hypothetical protein